MNEKLLEIRELTVKFGGLTAVDNVSFSIEPGEIFGLIGPNGAGKTTLFNMITGVLKPTSGSIVFNGRDITGLQPHIIAREGISRTFQNIKLFGKLTVLENVITVGQAHVDYSLIDGMLKTPKCRNEERNLEKMAVSLLERVGLAEYKDVRAGNLAYGLQRRVEIARALAVKPKLLLLDEPAAGMNEDESDKMVELVRNIRDEFDITVLVIDHHMDMIMKLCDPILVLNFGEQIAMGHPDKIKNDPTVIEAYLGVDEE